MRISYVASVTVPHDAISVAVRDEVKWLEAEGHEVLIFTYECGFPELPSHRVAKISDVVFNGHFQSSELVVFHFGVQSDLFDTILLCPERAKRIVVFHNITPPAVASPKERALLQRSLDQLPNAEFADVVFCVSEANLGVLRKAGVKAPARILPLAVHAALPAPVTKPSHMDGLVRLAFVGRFVQSKGVLDILEALNLAQAEPDEPSIRIDFLGSSKFSDPAVMDAIRNWTPGQPSHRDPRVHVELTSDATDEAKFALLAAADALVLPSYHEGFGVPILEALAQGCRVITYDNSAMPTTAGGLSTVVPTGDVNALHRAIEDEISRVRSADWIEAGYSEWSAEAGRHTEGFSPDETRRRFLTAIASVMSDEETKPAADE